MMLRALAATVAVLGGAVLAADPVAPMINQVGQLPAKASGPIEMKFAIVEPAPAVIATATATVANGVVTQLTLTNPGFGYVKVPAIKIAGGGGTGGRATATIANGQIMALTLVSGGSRYTAAPQVTIAEPTVLRPVETLWSNDLTSVAGSQPLAAVTLNVLAGSYAALLGYTGLPNMAPLPREVFAVPDARLRVWFKSSKNFKVVTLDAPLQAVSFADEATFAQMAGNVEAGAIGAAQVADGAITVSKLAPEALGALGASNLAASLLPSDPALAAQGFRRLQTFAASDWSTSPASGAPNPRARHSTLWTGSTLLVWGGEVGGQLSNQGGAYVPAGNSWSLLATLNAPAARAGHTAVWTGAQMIVWGGAESGGATASGGLYDPAEQLWRPTASTAAPDARTGHTAVWTGDRMLIWGGTNPGGALGDGASFTPPASLLPPGPAGSWTVLSATDAPTPRHGHTAIWTGTRMIVWGGLDANFAPLGNGAAFDPATGIWTPLPAANAPTPRFAHTAVWTGTKMIVFGGATSDVVANAASLVTGGAIYDAATNSWAPLPSAGAPEPRFRHGAVWTGSELLVFGGEGAGGQSVLSAGAFNPTTSAWRALPALPGATGTGVWSGQVLLTFGAAGLGVLDPAPTIHLYGKF